MSLINRKLMKKRIHLGLIEKSACHLNYSFKYKMKQIKHKEVWDSMIKNPNYYFDHKNKNFRKLIYKGVPQSHRAFLWPFLLRKNLDLGVDQKIEE
ncbi:hypothetical protein MXB_3982, partial [Myxobolus squamalis]